MSKARAKRATSLPPSPGRGAHHASLELEPLLAGPAAGLELGVGGGDAAGGGQGVAEGELGHAAGVGPFGTADHHAPLAGGPLVDVVDAGAIAADDPELLCLAEEGGGHLLDAGQIPHRVADHACELLLGGLGSGAGEDELIPGGGDPCEEGMAALGQGAGSDHHFFHGGAPGSEGGG